MFTATERIEIIDKPLILIIFRTSCCIRLKILQKKKERREPISNFRRSTIGENFRIGYELKIFKDKNVMMKRFCLDLLGLNIKRI